jgi:hypothetical protein
VSERNEVVVTYADLSESNDNEAIGDLLDELTASRHELMLHIMISRRHSASSMI